MNKKKIIVFLIIGLMILVSSVSAHGDTPKKKKGDHHKRVSRERYFFFEQQHVTVDNFDADGFILDIGGGGEGVIGQLKGQQAVAIDISKRELEEAPPGPLKIVMDGTDLKFLDNTFNTATVFFTFMYIPPNLHPKVFEELHRVMTPGGRLLIWDVIFPIRKNPKKDRAAFPFTFKLPGKEIKTGYGTKWPQNGMGLPHYLELAEAAGFKVLSKTEKGNNFYLELKKQ
ncbi:MAG: class I SAM-dependent methyltransferase [bacterium]|nr:class I SAM-dependent methyltransferase [bacterium]